MYRIIQEEPDGWEKAYAVYFAGRRITHFRFADSAQAWISERFA